MKRKRRRKRRTACTTLGRPALKDGCVPKVCGMDVELGNFILGINCPGGTGYLASRLLLAEIPGVPHASWGSSYGGWANSYGYPAASPGRSSTAGDGTDGSTLSTSAYGYDSQDWGRKFLPSNGGCAYIDLNHLELCIPEVRSAHESVAAWHAILLLARQAAEAASAKLPEGQRIQLLANNSDGLGNSYGGHINLLATRKTWDDIFYRKPHYLAYLASFQVSSIVITGQGKVGAENRAPAVAYQIAQRADFFERLCGAQTTFDRPIVNSRDEALCGPSNRKHAGSRCRSRLARLHCIFFDTNLCQVACLLKMGMMQIVLAMLERGRVDPRLLLDDPLEAVVRFSHDPTLKCRVATASAKHLTAVELQLWFLEEARRFHAAGGCDGIVPRADEILDLWADTLDKLRAGDLEGLAGRLDWVLKLQLLRCAMAGRPGLTWASPEVKHLDLLYSSLGEDGLYWACQRAGKVQTVVSPGQIEHFVHQPPDDTRAWTRAMLLRAAAPGQIRHVDWDSISVLANPTSRGSGCRTIEMPDPLGLTRSVAGGLFRSDSPLEDVLERLTTVSRATQNLPTHERGGNGYAISPARP